MPFSKTAFGRRALALLATGFAALLLIAGIATWMSMRTQRFAQAVVSTQHARADASALLVALQDAETGQRGFLLTQDEGYLQPYRQAGERIEAGLARLAADVDPASRKLVDELGPVARAKLREMAETVTLARNGDRARAIAMVQTGRGKALMEQARDQLSAIISRIDAQLAAESARVQHSAAILLATLSAASALLVAVAIAGAFIVVRYTRELDEARRAGERINEQLEERVRERTASLEEANEEVQRFAYIVSHDLRAPLVNIMGFTSELEVGLGALRELADAVAGRAPDLLTEEAKAAVREDIPEALGFIRSSTGRMDRLINAILRISREGRRQLVAERIDMNRLIERLGNSVAHQLAEKDGSFTVQGALPPAVSDRLALEQVFGNLIDNAVKYLDPSRPGRIVVRGWRERHSVVYEVTDNGRGIAPADAERVFELFRRAGVQDRPGEGIGLAHVRALLRRVNGTVSCQSQLDVGSTFRVTLPVAPLFRDQGRAPGTAENQHAGSQDREIAQ